MPSSRLSSVIAPIMRAWKTKLLAGFSEVEEVNEIAASVDIRVFPPLPVGEGRGEGACYPLPHSLFQRVLTLSLSRRERESDSFVPSTFAPPQRHRRIRQPPRLQQPRESRSPSLHRHFRP